MRGCSSRLRRHRLDARRRGSSPAARVDRSTRAAFPLSALSIDNPRARYRKAPDPQNTGARPTRLALSRHSEKPRSRWKRSGDDQAHRLGGHAVAGRVAGRGGRARRDALPAPEPRSADRAAGRAGPDPRGQAGHAAPDPGGRGLDALPKACEVDAALCERVRRFLANYMHVSGVAFASYEVAAASGSGDKTVMPNQHGAGADSHYRAAAAGYLQPSDYLLLGVGGVADEGRATATGSVLSAGFDFAQLDLGYRDHWWSPMTDSAMLISTEAPTMPSITLSNYRPLTRLGLEYELFVARMSHSNDIELTNGTLTRGYPKFGGLHLSFEPVSGWALGAQRVIVWGGGAAGGQSFKDILKAFFNPSRAQSTGFATGQSVHVIGKQEGGVSSRFIFPGRTPFAVYFEYAGNDTVQGHNYLLGKPDLSAGIHFPHLGPFDVTFEASQWEPTWYVHHFSSVETGYGDGISNDRLNIGHWFGDQRVFGDAVGGRSNMLRVGFEPPFGGLLEAEYRMLVNDY